MPWAILMRFENRLDGKRKYFQGTPHHPCRTLLFETRRDARKYINEHYGYWRQRPDLRAEPFGWKFPVAVHVKVIVEPV